MTPRLLILNPTCLDVIEAHRHWIEAEHIELLAEQSYLRLDEDAALALLRQVNGVVLPAKTRTFPHAHQMEACPRLRVCSIAGSGFDWLDVAAATRQGIIVARAAGQEGAEVVADMAWGLMLAVARQIPLHHQQVCLGNHARGMGSSAFGKTLGIIGLGHIGRAVAQRARGFRMRVLATVRHPEQASAFARANNIELTSLDDLLWRSEFISLHLPLGEQNRHIIGRRELSLMRPDAILINTARQELVDDQALFEAISESRILGAGLDDPPGEHMKKLVGHPHVVFTPHIGNRAIEGVNGVFRTAVWNCLRVFRGERPEEVLNPAAYCVGVQHPRPVVERPERQSGRGTS